jgi:uncharacterized protein YlxW (UPF0749 family)
MDARALQKGLALAVPALVFGFLVAAQWGTLALPASHDVSLRYTDPLSETVSRLEDEQSALKTELADVRGKLDDLQRSAATQSGAARRLAGRIDQLKTGAGLAEARGEGVTVTLDPRSAASLPAERQPCFAPDLTDIVNAAWRGGALAVAINAERLVSSSSVYCVGGTIVVNGSVVSAPFAVSAVGTQSSIMAVLDDPAQLKDLKKRRDQQAIGLQVTRESALVLPGFTGPLAVRSAVPQ